jgi:hypothetical protein
MLHFFRLNTDPFWRRYSRHARAVKTLQKQCVNSDDLCIALTRLVTLGHAELQVDYNSETAERSWSIENHKFSMFMVTTCTHH